MVLGQDPSLVNELDAGVVLAVASVDSDSIEAVHQHPHGSVFLLRAGYVISESAAGRWLIPAGHLGWVPPFVVHGAELVGVRGVRIYLAREVCETLRLPGEPVVVRVTPLVLAVVDRLVDVGAPRRSLPAQEERLLAVLRDEAERAQSPPIQLPMPRDASVLKAAEKLLRDVDGPMGLCEVAAHAGMSRRTFTRKFKLDTGLSVGKWRQLARLMHGIEMLAAGKSVTETAFALGYDSISSFVALCQRQTGMSPTALARAVAAGDR